MKIKNINELKTAISRVAIFSFFVIFGIALILLIIIHSESNLKRQELFNQQLQDASKLYQSSLAEKLGIVASSTSFLDYIRSGDETRKILYPEFISTLLPLKTKSIIGMQISPVSGNFSAFSYGQQSPFNITLRLCYLDRNLDPDVGDCNYLWTLYFSKENITAELQKFNPNILVCNNCKPVDIFSNVTFGNFPIAHKTDFPINITMHSRTLDLFWLYASIIVVTLITITFWNRARIKKLLNKFIAAPIEEVTRSLQNNSPLQGRPEYLTEIIYLIEQIEAWREKEREAKIGQLAAQVAHDIRSPLAALQIILQKVTQLDENARSIIINAVSRINDIANNLLTTYREAKVVEYPNAESSMLTAELIADVLDRVISEKRMQFSEKDISFELEIVDDTRGVFAKVNVQEFQRVLSNIINNGVEAIKHKNGKILVRLTRDTDTISIDIIDDGIGMPAELIAKIGQESFSFGKISGIGLGLKTAIQAIKAWNGRYTVESKVNEGTKFSIHLSINTPPLWFLESIKITEDTKLFVVDDDDTIHKVWDNRFLTHQNIFHFYSPQELISFFTDTKIRNFLCLIDYEFVNSVDTGLDLISKLELFDRAVLVTSHYVEKTVLEQAIEMGVKIIPKNFAPYIPIEIMGKDSVDLILIDDDKMITDAWSFKAKHLGKSIATFNDTAIFMKEIDRYNKDIPLYIDSHLYMQKGEDFAKELYDKYGFTNIYIATGYSKDEFPEGMYWIRSIVGKEPPF
jgi:signal transduction histidine kinase